MNTTRYKPVIYVAGPYTAPLPKWKVFLLWIRWKLLGEPYGELLNVRKALLVAEHLSNLGYIPYVPHLSYIWQKFFPHDYRFWMNICTNIIPRCDVVFRMDEPSNGADYEVSKAKEFDVPVIRDYGKAMIWIINWELKNKEIFS